MQHPNLPHRPPAAEPSGGLSVAGCSQDEFSTSLPPHPQVPVTSSPSNSSCKVSSIADPTHERTHSNHRHFCFPMMKPNDSEDMNWSAPNDFSNNLMGRGDLRYHMPTLAGPVPDMSHQSCQNGMSCNDNCSLAYPTQYPSYGYNHLYEGLQSTGLPYNLHNSEAYPPAVYQIEPQKFHEAVDLNDQMIDGQLKQLSIEYENYPYGTSHAKSEDKNNYQSPYSELTDTCTTPDDSSRYPTDTDTVNEPPVDKDLPYAQLIYQALMAAPEKTMILRDIYEWFSKYTDKSHGSETKGWQNSIRHNLSMNGAFEKVIQPCEESRKGFMWRLTEDAIRNGVKSTTRYRSKHPTKRAYRSHHRQPQRQASGAKGGQAARRSARLRRGNGGDTSCRSEPYISHPAPRQFNLKMDDGEESMPYAPSPYYRSEADFGCGSANSEYGKPLMVPGVNLYPMAPSYPGSPIPHGLPITDNAFVMDQSPTASLFSNSPSPSTSEPRTPDYQDSWHENINLGMPCVYDESDFDYCDYAN